MTERTQGPELSIRGPTLAKPLLILVALLTTSPAGAERDSYPLDHLGRTISPRGKVRCPDLPMVRYEGEVIRYHKPVRVFDGFAPRLTRFEAVVRDVALEVYGRAPTRIRHLGTYSCRRIKAYPSWISEHGLGNGIDIAGFSFARLPRAERRESTLPRRLHGAFKVSVLKHWGAEGKVGGLHSRFLREVAERLAARDDIFRVMLGPGFPGHRNHFHFDCGPWRIVEIDGID
jgi:hypothetical protein